MTLYKIHDKRHSFTDEIPSCHHIVNKRVLIYNKHSSRHMKKIIIIALTLLSAIACSENSANTSDKPAMAEGTLFELHVSNGMSFNQNSKRAKAHPATNKIISFKATDWYFRIHGLGLPDYGTAKTDKLGKNNTLLTMKVEIDGKNVKVACHTAENPKGSFHRTQLTDGFISGEFAVEFVSCNEYLTGKKTNYPEKPFYAKGNFSHFPLKK